MSGMDMVKHKPSRIETLKNVTLIKIKDQTDTAYTDVIFKDHKGRKYYLVIHDIYIEKEKIFEGYEYMVKYRKHQLFRPDYFIETID
jgi:hypothetical protein